VWAAALACGCSAPASVNTVQQSLDGGAATRRLIYAAFNDGTIHVYDIDARHAEIGFIATVTGVSDVRGACATAGGFFYIAHQRPEAGYVVAVDLHKEAVVWSRAFQPNVDRLSCAAGGKKLYVPSNEAYATDDSLIVVDAASGDELKRIHISPRVHDSVPNLDGSRVYVETKSSNLVSVVDTTSDSVVGTIGPFAGIGGPFTITGRETRVYANVFGVNGFQVGDGARGSLLATVSIPGERAVAGQLDQHGIALDPREDEVWVTDGVGGKPLVHVFDVTATPPAPKHDVTVDYGGPHWITFSIAGDYAYVAGPKLGDQGTDVVDARTYAKVATIGPSEDLLEVDWKNGKVVAVGSQFGVGRVGP
jgi:YVTN family beta-propeller protein